MPWSGAGTYAPPVASFPEVNGTTIDAARFNPTISDLATGITAALAKNGENVATANLPMGGFKHTGAGAGTGTGEYLGFGAVGTITTATITTLNVSGVSTLNGNVVLGDAVGDTITIGGGSSKGASGNWTFAAPSSGTTVAIVSVAGTVGLLVSSAAASDVALSLQAISYARDWRLKVLNSSGSFVLRDETGTTDRITVGVAGNVTISAPSSGNTLAMTVLSSQNAITVTAPAAATSYPVASTNATSVLALAHNSDNSVGFGTTSAHTAHVMTSNSNRISVGSAGNVTIAAPGAGVGLTITGGGLTVTGASILTGAVSGVTTLSMSGALSGATTGSFSGAVTASNLISGTWTPTLADVTNTTSRGVVSAGHWLRLGSVVYAAVQITIDPTASATPTSITLTLPVASNLANSGDLCGVGTGGSNQLNSGPLSGVTVSDLALFEFFANDGANQTYVLQFSYQVI